MSSLARISRIATKPAFRGHAGGATIRDIALPATQKRIFDRGPL